MYAPDWYVSDGHLFAWLLIKSDNYELLQQTCTQLVILDQWEIPRTSLYYSPVAGKSRSSRKLTLLQSTRRWKQVTPPIFTSATLLNLFSPEHFISFAKFFSRNNFMLRKAKSDGPIIPMQIPYVLFMFRTTGILFSKLEFYFDNKGNHHMR